MDHSFIVLSSERQCNEEETLSADQIVIERLLPYHSTCFAFSKDNIEIPEIQTDDCIKQYFSRPRLLHLGAILLIPSGLINEGFIPIRVLKLVLVKSPTLSQAWTSPSTRVIDSGSTQSAILPPLLPDSHHRFSGILMSGREFINCCGCPSLHKSSAEAGKRLHSIIWAFRCQSLQHDLIPSPLPTFFPFLVSGNGGNGKEIFISRIARTVGISIVEVWNLDCCT